MIKVIIAGSRHITDYNLVKDFIESLNLDIYEVICGMARGVDLLGRRWAIENKIDVIEFPAQWDKYGKSAGYKRNVEMANYANETVLGGGLILIWDGKSKGSGHMKDIAEKAGLKIWEKII